MKKLLVLLVVGFFIVSCSDDDDDRGWSPENLDAQIRSCQTQVATAVSSTTAEEQNTICSCVFNTIKDEHKYDDVVVNVTDAARKRLDELFSSCLSAAGF